MVHTRNQPFRDLSPATSGRPTTTTGGLVPATSHSVVTSSVTAAGDFVTSGRKTATGELLSSQPGSTLVVTSPPTSNVHFSASASATPRTRVTSSDVGTSPFGEMAQGSASANPISSHDWDPLITGSGGSSEPAPILALPTGQLCCHCRCNPTIWANMAVGRVGMFPPWSEIPLTYLGLRPMCTGLLLSESRTRACWTG